MENQNKFNFQLTDYEIIKQDKDTLVLKTLTQEERLQKDIIDKIGFKNYQFIMMWLFKQHEYSKIDILKILIKQI